MSYREISGLSLIDKRGRIGAAVIGLIIIVTSYYNYLEDWIYSAGVGALTLIYGVLYRRNWFEFKGSHLLQNKDEAAIWRLTKVKDPDVNDFVRKVRTMLVNKDY
ncbi:MAG: hypothetical protein NWE89_08650 [Candidatus Bathyarchaeota archaeon]|nr:hypothetical protein [Candidatus Bathyarchaeota archaeon]